MSSSSRVHEAAAHVLAIPYMLQGHITPMLRLATQLARNDITVSFICYEDSIPRLTSSGGDASTELRGLDFRFVTLQKPRIDPRGYEDVPRAVVSLDAMHKDAFEPLMEKLTCDKSAGAACPTCIISDMFLPWISDVAEKLQLPRYTLVTGGVAYARLMQGSLEYFERGHFQAAETDGGVPEFDWSVCISGLPPLRYHELNGRLRRSPGAFRRTAEAMMKSAGVLVNSFFELEEKVVEAFRNPGDAGDKQTKVPKIYPVGPLFSTTALTNSSNVYGLEDSSSKCLRWLDSQPNSSVLYIAFGSLVRLGPEQIKELACGLEASKQRFLWVCPLKKIDSEEESPSITEVLPPGFQQRVGDRGCIVIGWAPQLEILAHSSTGGFFTHSGWNSALESIVFGVPMIAWPQAAEQHLNCRYMVDVLKVAEQLQVGKENFANRDEVERAVRLLMIDPEGRAIRSRAEELKTKAAEAMTEGRSQSRFFQEFVHDIRCLQTRE